MLLKLKISYIFDWYYQKLWGFTEALTIWKGFLRNSNDFFASTTRLSLFLFLHHLKVNFAKFYRETGYKDLKLF